MKFVELLRDTAPQPGTTYIAVAHVVKIESCPQKSRNGSPQSFVYYTATNYDTVLGSVEEVKKKIEEAAAG